jgi:hypothetical protein
MKVKVSIIVDVFGNFIKIIIKIRFIRIIGVEGYIGKGFLKSFYGKNVEK